MSALELCPICNNRTVKIIQQGTGEDYITIHDCHNGNCDYKETFP